MIAELKVIGRYVRLDAINGFIFLTSAIFLGRGEWGDTSSSLVTASTTCIFGRLRMSSKMSPSKSQHSQEKILSWQVY